MNDLITARPDKHSSLGIASVVLATVSVILNLVTWYWLNGVHQRFETTGTHDASSGDVIGLVILLFCLLLIFLGLLLALIGCFQKRRKRLFAVLGLLINSALLATVVLYTAFSLGFL
jgi:hypothetical protein